MESWFWEVLLYGVVIGLVLGMLARWIGRKLWGVKSVAAKGFVLIETVVGRGKEVVVALSKLEGVDSVAVTGPYDIIAVIEGETLQGIGDLVTSKIHPIAGISRTVTCLAI